MLEKAYMFQSPSLRGSGRFSTAARGRTGRASSLNPLHCGAVVASRGGPSCRRRRDAGLNPLHCGAVVASPPRRKAGAGKEEKVSIPFIAGQWSLLNQVGLTLPISPCFNPLHCGAVVASDALGTPSPVDDLVSIPFIAGQWSLLYRESPRLYLLLGFQSPSLRGSGRFREYFYEFLERSLSFNPLHCGAVVASTAVSFS